MLKEDFIQIKNSNIAWESFANQTVLITGANGFLPAYMVETILLLNTNILKENPCKIIALVRNKQHTHNRFREYLKNPNLIFLIQDIKEEINLPENTKIDYIIHAASPASPKYYYIDPINVALSNVLGTKNMLDIALKNQVKSFLFFSSGEVYGNVITNNSLTENYFGSLDPTNIRSCYAESKRMGENLCIIYKHQYHIPVKIVRPFHTYGPGMKLDDGRIFADFVENIVNDKNIEIKSNGSAKRTFCYLADATTAFFKVLLNGKAGEAYNIANPLENISIKDLAEKLINLYPKKGLKIVYTKHNHTYLQSSIKNQLPNISKINALNWFPSTKVEDGFKKTIGSYL